MRSRILGTGSYAPKQVLTNADLETMVETSDSWIVERTGIRERRVAAPGEACSDLGVLAAQQALADANVQASQLDLIVVATCTGDSPLPSTASFIQHRLGAVKAAACDVSAACCGFIYALSVADAYVCTGYRYVLVIGSEVMSSIIDWTDRDVFRYLKRHDLPYHPLWHKNYLSIGDVHTTRRVGEGMSEEEARFFGLKRECGLHEGINADFNI